MRLILSILFLCCFIHINAFQAEPALEILKDYDKVRDFTMSNNETEAYVSAQSNLEEKSVIVRITKENGIWNKVDIASFSGKYRDLEPFLSPDNLKLFFVSNRPLTSEGELKDVDIWYVERATTSSDWSEPKNIGAPINTEADEFYPSVAKNGNLYFTSVGHDAMGEDDIFVSEFKNGKYSKPVPLKGGVNTKSYEYNSFISPNEDYLIFGGYARKDGLGSGDLYVSFKNDDNTWTQAKNMGDQINSKFMDFCPFVTNSGTQLYFTSRRSNIDANKSIKSAKNLLNTFNGYENGFSRIYMTSFDLNAFKN
ncbi:TolB family protein [Pontimicrobium aquaticum]|uniref:WD40-like Beta Propeller Repeat n=1 Tax=Pontimicrobium aquaticum TaxID=2565367 RepID=A0A4U0EQV2_9FLAO|nr:PD40 domain-containing protein [Pontimicrobium aquaticum]TJY34105.1 hypothetical protein E5167_12380 [Pontimicrobium aquaticum]